MEDNEKCSLKLLFGFNEATMIGGQLVNSCTCLKKLGSMQVWKRSKGAKSQKRLESDQFPRTAPKTHDVLSDLDDQKKEKNCKQKGQRQRQT